MKFLIFLSLLLLVNGRPQYPGSPVGLVYRAQNNIPLYEGGFDQETRNRRQPHETGEEHVHDNTITNGDTHGSNGEHDFHFDEMPMKSFVQLGPNEVEDKQPLTQ